MRVAQVLLNYFSISFNRSFSVKIYIRMRESPRPDMKTSFVNQIVLSHIIDDYLASKLSLVMSSIGLGVIEQVVIFWHHMGIVFFQKEKSPLPAIGNLRK